MWETHFGYDGIVTLEHRVVALRKKQCKKCNISQMMF